MHVRVAEVFCLLGQNGAGKTTTFNLLMGNLNPSSGTIRFVHHDPRVGLCPQHDVLLDYTTCLKQLELMAEMSGLGRAEARDEAMDMMKHLAIDHKAHETPNRLSGGQRRRLSVAMACIGNSAILFMDEPTTGLDPLNRRQVWTLIRKKRQEGRTVILTTHSMEEAEALSDRIGIMAQGKMQALGTTIELRKHFGPWFHLAATKIAQGSNAAAGVDDTADAAVAAFDAGKLLSFVAQHVPGATILQDQGPRISFNLPLDSIDSFPVLLDRFEASKRDYGIISFQISPSTLDDVFMRLAHENPDQAAVDVEESKVFDDTTGNGDSAAAENEAALADAAADVDEAALQGSTTFTSAPTSAGQYFAMLRFLGLWNVRSPDAWSVILINVVLFSVLAGVLNALTTDVSDTPVAVEIPAGIQFPYAVTDPVLQGDAEMILGENAGQFVDLLNGGQTVLEVVATNFDVAGFTFDNIAIATAGIDATIAYSPFRALSTRIGVQTLYQGLADAADELPTPTNATIGCTYQPWRAVAQQNDLFATNQLHFAALAIGGCGAVAGQKLAEMRYTHVKDVLLLTGLKRTVFWASLFTVQFAYVLGGSFMSYGILYASGLNAIVEGPFVIYFMSYLLCAPAIVLWGFVIASCYSVEQKGETIGFVVGSLPAIPWAIVVFALGEPYLTLEFLFTVFIPSFGIFRLCALFQVASYNGERLSTAEAMEWTSVVPQVWLSWVLSITLAVGYLFLFDFVGLDGIRRMLSLSSALADDGAVHPTSSASAGNADSADDSNENVRDVLAGVLPQPVAAFPANAERHGLTIVCEGGSKSFAGKVAVRDASFGVAKGSILGLLGPNGAGKTTLIKCISGLNETVLDAGDAFVNKVSVTTDLDHARREMGVCPQFDAFVGVLSPRQLLTSFARIRGVPEVKVEHLVNTFLKDLTLMPKADTIGLKLSGGNKRKLSIGLATIANPPAIFLDEPTTGIDPATRHDIWNFLLHGSTVENRGAVITTHSMEEADMLCSRLAIMVQSSIRTSGTPEKLKERYGGGLVVTLAVDTTKVSEPRSHAESIVQSMHGLSMIYDDVRSNSHLFKFVLPTTIAWSHMFGVLNKAENLLDFSISQRSLEDVFVQLASLQHTSD
jgi:ABC-type multidrug transport system ATPase subunit